MAGKENWIRTFLAYFAFICAVVRSPAFPCILVSNSLKFPFVSNLDDVTRVHNHGSWRGRLRHGRASSKGTNPQFQPGKDSCLLGTLTWRFLDWEPLMAGSSTDMQLFF